MLIEELVKELKNTANISILEDKFKCVNCKYWQLHDNKNNIYLCRHKQVRFKEDGKCYYNYNQDFACIYFEFRTKYLN